MQSMAATNKKDGRSSSQKSRHVQSPHALKLPVVNKADPADILKRIHTRPDSLTRDDIMFLQNTIGNKAVIKLLSQAKGKGEAQKIENGRSPEKPDLSQKAQQSITKVETVKKEEAKHRSVLKDDNIKGSENGKQENLQSSKHTPGKKTAQNQSEPLVDMLGFIGKDDGKKGASKAQAVKIKGESPEQVLEQLGNAAPSTALDAYSQAVAVSGRALEKQKQKTQKIIPSIPAAAGLKATRKPGKTGKQVTPFKHSAPSAFKSAKSGGHKQERVLGEFDIQSKEEQNPEEIMSEARSLCSNAPGISLTGEADPSQMEGFQTEAAQEVQGAKQIELGQINSDFGENNIYPEHDNSILKSKRVLKSLPPHSKKIKQYMAIPGDMGAQLDRSLAPELHKEINSKKKDYQAGKEKFDSDVAAAKVDSDIQIENLRHQAREKQLNEQVSAKAEVNKLRGQWKNEIDDTLNEYDQKARTASQEKKSEIAGIKKQKEVEVQKRLEKAEKDAHQEYKAAKTKAENKKKESEEQKKAKDDRNFFQKAWDWGKEKVQQFIDGLKKAINFIFEGLRKAVKAIFDLAKSAVTGIIELGRRLITGIIKNLGNLLKGFVSIVFAKFPAISKRICGLIDKAVSKAVNAVNKAADFLKKGVTSVLDSLASTLDNLLGAIQSLYNTTLGILGDIISGKFADVMERIGALGKAAKNSLSHIEGALWKQLVGIDLSKPMEAQPDGAALEAVDMNQGGAANEKLTENDIEVERIETGEISPAMLHDLNIKDGEVKTVPGSNNPYTMKSILNEFDTGKETRNSAGGVKTRAENAGKILDQIKEFAIKWLEDNWLKLLLGVTAALAGIIAAEILTGGAITAALPTIISIITNIMQAQAVVSIAATIAQAADQIGIYLTQGWAKNINVAAAALAAAIAMGLVELAMSLGFKAVGAGLKATGKAVKKGMSTAAKGVRNLARSAGTSVKSLLKSGAKLVSRSGNMLIRNGKLVIRSLKEGLLKGTKRVREFINKLLARFKFKSFKFERKGRHLRVYGEVNPWILLYDGTIEQVDEKDLQKIAGTNKTFDYKGKQAVLISREIKETAEVAKLKGLPDAERINAYNKAVAGVSKAAEAIERAVVRGSKKTWDEFLNANSGKSIQDVSNSYIKLINEQSPWPEGLVPQQRVLKPGDTFQMALDSTQPVTSPGSFGTFDNIPSVDYVRNNLAVKSDWKVDCSKVVTYRVKEGVGLPVLEGPVGSQIDLNADKYLPGGGSQIQMLLDRNANKMDYLEVVSVRSIN